MRKIFKSLMMLTAVATLTACVKDSMDMTQVEKTAKASYAENFAQKYPNVTLNQSWDYIG